MATVTGSMGDMRQTRRFLGYCLVWGAVALGLMAWWLREKYAGDMPVAVQLTVVVLAIVAIFAGCRNLLQRIDNGQLLEAQSRQVGFILVGTGGILLILAIWLLTSQKLAAMGEGMGLALFGALALITGLVQVRPPGHGEQFFLSLASARDTIKFGCIGIGALVLLTGVVLAYKSGVLERGRDLTDPKDAKAKLDEPTPPADRWAVTPEAAASVMLGMVLLGGGLYLARRETASAQTMRLFVLMTGGLAGLAVTLLAIIRAWTWRSVMLGGLAQWRGAEAWKIWLCIYLGLIGLLVMFGCFLFARTDIRTNPVLRRVLYGYNAVLNGLLLLLALVVLNIVVYVAYPLTFNWTESQGIYALSPKSVDILEKIKEPTTIHVLLDQSQYPNFKDVKALLENCTALTDKLTINYLSPDKDLLGYNELAQKYPEIVADTRLAIQNREVGRGILVVYGPETKDKPAPHAFIGVRKLTETSGGFGRQQTSLFKGEDALMSDLQYLIEGQKKAKVYFLQGNGEMDLGEGSLSFRADPRFPVVAVGMSKLLERLRTENIEVKGLSFGDGKDPDTVYLKATGKDKDKSKDVPDDARVLVIAGPSQTYPKEVLDALGRYMERNGRLVVLFDIITDEKFEAMKSSGLEEFLRKYNVDVTTEYVLRAPFVEMEGRVVLLKDDYLSFDAVVPLGAKSVLGKKFQNKIFPMRTARVIRPMTNPSPFRAEVLASVRGDPEQGEVLLENLTKVIANPAPYLYSLEQTGRIMQKIAREPLPVAVTVTEGEDRPRLAVFGDAEWIADFAVTRLKYRNHYFNIFASTLDYLADRPGVGIRPKEVGTYMLNPEAPVSRMLLLPVWVIAYSVLGLGIAIWVVRRR